MKFYQNSQILRINIFEYCAQNKNKHNGCARKHVNAQILLYFVHDVKDMHNDQAAKLKVTRKTLMKLYWTKQIFPLVIASEKEIPFGKERWRILKI